MRTALRTSIVTAALAGALLAPAAGSAFAAPVPHTVAGTTAAAASVVKVDIGDNLMAHMSNSAAQGPRVAIHIVVDGVTQPKTMTTLDRSHTVFSRQGTTFTLTKALTAEPVLTVVVVTAEGGTTKSYPLPKGTATSPASCVSEVKTVRLGEYQAADLTMSPKGPKAVVNNLEGAPFTVTLDRTHPKSPKSDSVRIDNPSGAKPVFRWKYQVEESSFKSASFPALPKGCKLDYQITEEQGSKPAPKPKPKTGTQTTVVPKGPVAAGAELSVVADTDNTTTAAAGAGLVAVFGALGASVFLRRHRAQG
ncbi:hypothetical protein OTB20_07105 [Streptomyces sp. H27-H1]|uniref:hypothetical protein n=1 Tax=Streptomyces sp. H27-H1 TaxID=2996461 RepID=UPI002272232E|nr:hypothetical protein [Streptomyces sp. H27-H1]MCY0925979.1 hypothetical protein [Streptomyces sp. H27-H1]